MSMLVANSVPPAGFTVRHDLKPGDLGSIVHLHGITYAAEYGFDYTFEAYVAEPLAVFARSQTNRDRLWIVERERKIVACIAIVGVSVEEAQLRWFLVDPSVRGMGLGKHLIVDAVSFCKRFDYVSVFLWTVTALTTAAHVYRSLGFSKAEENPCHQWGVDVVEEKYVLNLVDP
jgi:GNAT superfamily N-acetyltransferase